MEKDIKLYISVNIIKQLCTSNYNKLLIFPILIYVSDSTQVNIKPSTGVTSVI